MKWLPAAVLALSFLSCARTEESPDDSASALAMDAGSEADAGVCRSTRSCWQLTAFDGGCLLQPEADGTACSEPCLEAGSCQSGVCVGNLRSCDDGDACTADACGANGECVHVPRVCGSAPCQQAACDPVQGCLSSPAPDGTPCGPYGATCKNGYCPANRCDDGNPCTIDDFESDGGCRHMPLECRRSNECLSAQCNPLVGCTESPIADGTACGAPGSCLEGTCQSGACVSTATLQPTPAAATSASVQIYASQFPSSDDVLLYTGLYSTCDAVLSRTSPAGALRWNTVAAQENCTSGAYRPTMNGSSVLLFSPYAQLAELSAADGGVLRTRDLTLADGGTVNLTDALPRPDGGLWVLTHDRIYALGPSLTTDWVVEGGNAYGSAIASADGDLYVVNLGSGGAVITAVAPDGAVRWTRPTSWALMATEGGDLFLRSGEVLDRSTGALRYRVAITEGYALVDGAYAAYITEECATLSTPCYRVVRFDRATGAIVMDAQLPNAATAPFLSASHSLWTVAAKSLPRPLDVEPSSDRYLLELKPDGSLRRHCLTPEPYHVASPGGIVTGSPSAQPVSGGLWFRSECGDDCHQFLRVDVPGLQPASGWSTVEGNPSRQRRP